jgi:hypothetical protein
LAYCWISLRMLPPLYGNRPRQASRIVPATQATQTTELTDRSAVALAGPGVSEYTWRKTTGAADAKGT